MRTVPSTLSLSLSPTLFHHIHIGSRSLWRALSLSLSSLGGCNVNDLDPVWYRRHIGIVNQEPVLFATTIRDNIAFGKEDASQEEVLLP